jgi:hypothetical protein
MGVSRPLFAMAAAFAYSFLVFHAAGCGTDAVGVDECRDIEEARCEAAQFCDIVDDVDACKRFYRDQCLHGLANGEQPGAPDVKKCVASIKNAGQCAKNGVETLADCVPKPSEKTALTKVCDVVLTPELVTECDFLAKPVELPDAASEPAVTPDSGGDAPADAPGE